MFIAIQNEFLRVGKTLLTSWFDQLCVVEDNEDCIIIFRQYFLHYFFANIFHHEYQFIKEN
jgi:hypothetical protein